MESENVNGSERSNNINILTSERIKTLSKFRRHSTRLQGICNNLETVSEQEQENTRPYIGGGETQSILPHRLEYERRRSGLIKGNIYDNNLSELPICSKININKSRRRSSLLLKQNDVDKESDVTASLINRNPAVIKHGFDYKSIDSSAKLSPTVAPASKGFITQRRSDDICTNELTEEEKMAVEASLEEQEDVTVRLNSLRRRSELGDMFENIKSQQPNMIESDPKLSYITNFVRKSNITGYQKEESKVPNQNDKVPNNVFNTPYHKKVYSQGNVSNGMTKEYKIPSIHVDVATCEKLQLKSDNKERYFDEDETENTSQTRTRNVTGGKKNDSDQSGNIRAKNNFPDQFKLQNSFGQNKDNDKSNYTCISQNNDYQINEYQTEMRTPISENKTPRSVNKLSSNVMVKKNFPEWFKPTTSIGKNNQTHETGLTDLCQGYDIAPSPYKVYEKERKKNAMQAIIPMIEAARDRRKSQMLLQKSSSKKQTPEVVTRNRNIELLKSNRNMLLFKSPTQSKSLLKTPSMLKKANLGVDFQECRRALEYEQEKDEHNPLIPPGTPLEPMTPNLEKISGPLFRGTKIAINKPAKAITTDVISNSFIEEPKSVISQNTSKPLKRKSLHVISNNCIEKPKSLLSQNTIKPLKRKSLQNKRKSLLVIPNSYIEEPKSLQSQNIVKPLKIKSPQNRVVQPKIKPPLVQTSKYKNSYTLHSNKNVINQSTIRSKHMSINQEVINKQRIKAKTPVRRRSSILMPPLKSSKKKRKSVGNTKLPRSKLNPREVLTSSEKIPENDHNSSDCVTDNVLKSKICESPCSTAVVSEVISCDASTSTALQWNDGSNMGLDTHLMEQVAQLEAEHERIMDAAQTLVEQTAQRRKRMREQGMMSKFSESISPLKRLRTILTSKPSSVAIVEQLCEEETQIPSNGNEVCESNTTNTDDSETPMHTSVLKEDCTTPGNKSVRFNETTDIHEHSDMDMSCSPSSADNSFLLNETSLNASGMEGAGVYSLNNSVHHMESLKNTNKFLKTPASQKLKPFKKPNSITIMGPPTIHSEEEEFTDGSNSPFTELVGDCERPSIAPYMTPHSRKQVSVLKDALNRQLADLFD